MVHTRWYDIFHLGCIAYYVYYTNLYKKPEPTPSRSLVVDGKTWFWLSEILTNLHYWNIFYEENMIEIFIEICTIIWCHSTLAFNIVVLCIFGAIYNIIQMNIFELILSDPFSYQQVSSDLSNHYSNWSIFKQNMKILFSVGVQDTDHFIIKSR